LKNLFAGIGSGIVCLKRLGIAIEKIIHVEHDKVATHVYRCMHDSTYNALVQDDGISHVYYEKFEEFESNLDTILSEQGRKYGAKLHCELGSSKWH
jgi:site-specific DNA-cytosine methylase